MATVQEPSTSAVKVNGKAEWPSTGHVHLSALRECRDKNCTHRHRIHSNADGQCLGGTLENPMSCKCTGFIE